MGNGRATVLRFARKGPGARGRQRYSLRRGTVAMAQVRRGMRGVQSRRLQRKDAGAMADAARRRWGRIVSAPMLNEHRPGGRPLDEIAKAAFDRIAAMINLRVPWPASMSADHAGAAFRCDHDVSSVAAWGSIKRGLQGHENWHDSVYPADRDSTPSSGRKCHLRLMDRHGGRRPAPADWQRSRSRDAVPLRHRLEPRGCCQRAVFGLR
jgi:hypothetical protein